MTHTQELEPMGLEGVADGLRLAAEASDDCAGVQHGVSTLRGWRGRTLLELEVVVAGWAVARRALVSIKRGQTKGMRYWSEMEARPLLR